MNAPVLTAVAWPYANGPRHIGHVSGFGVPSDIFSRYQRMAGNRVLMVSGTDENGTPIQVQADAEGVTPRELADKYNRMIVADLQGLGLSYDLFTRTSTANHHRVVQDVFLALYRNGYILTKTALGAISPSTGRTLPDRYIEGTCPICGYDGVSFSASHRLMWKCAPFPVRFENGLGMKVAIQPRCSASTLTM
jgi:methionyl-tRNA synthetase